MLEENYPLFTLNTFSIDVRARYYICLESKGQVREALPRIMNSGREYMIFGAGSNVLFTKDYEGTILHICLKGIELIAGDTDHMYVRVYAGEDWDSFVEYAANRGYGGIENLSLIPGSVGSSPVQNIGAYGKEVKDVIVQVEGFSLPGLEFKTLKNEECRFSYRSSVFKEELKNKFLISSVVFRLEKKPVFELSYGTVREVFESKSAQNILTLRESVIEIRTSKLPDHKEYGNAGSFFKNPVVPLAEYQALKVKWPNMPGHFSGEGYMKIPAAWLIENAGWKGAREGDVGTWPLQPLVIVNFGKATGREIFEFSEKIRRDVLVKFGVRLEREVNVV